MKTYNEIYQVYRKFSKELISTVDWWNFIEGEDNAIVRAVIENRMKADDRLRRFKKTPYFRFKIRAYCNFHGYTDIHPFEVIKVISPSCVLVRSLATKQTVKPKEFHPGGFSGHYADNRNQKYEYSQDLTAKPIRLRLGKKGWGLGNYRMADKPFKFYDYNF